MARQAMQSPTPPAPIACSRGNWLRAIGAQGDSDRGSQQLDHVPDRGNVDELDADEVLLGRDGGQVNLERLSRCARLDRAIVGVAVVEQRVKLQRPWRATDGLASDAQ